MSFCTGNERSRGPVWSGENVSSSGIESDRGRTEQPIYYVMAHACIMMFYLHWQCNSMHGLTLPFATGNQISPCNEKSCGVFDTIHGRGES